MLQEERVSIWCMILLSALSGVVDLCYAVEGVYAIPVILAAGIPFRYASLMLSLSPLLGLIVQPFIGSATDHCYCSWGRRKPFILLFGFIVVACCGSIPYYFYLKQVPYSQYIIPSCIVLCIMFFDLCIGIIIIPAKAIMMDLIPPSQETKANAIASTGVGLFACIGYGLGAVDWTWVTGKHDTIETQSQIVFGITTVIFAVVILISLLCLREKSSVKTIYTATPASINNTTNKMVSEVNYGSITISTSSNIHEIDNQSSKDNEDVQASCTSCVNPFVLLKNSIIDIIQYCYYMSRHMWILFFTFTMAFAADFSFTYSFSVYVGTVVYEGDSGAPVGTESFKRYSSGVRMGSLGLAIGNFINIFVSLILEKCSKYASLKTLVLFGIAPFTCATCLLMYFHQLPATLVLASTYGPYLGLMSSVGYGFMANYKVSTNKYMHSTLISHS